MYRSLVILLLSCALQAAAAATFIVQDSQPLADIVIAEQPPRAVPIAARELQAYIAKISGATLPIGTSPAETMQVHIYVGQSTHTDKLGVSVEGLEADGYRIKSGANWLALIGKDLDYTPKEPWARSRNDIPRAQAEFEKLTNSTWNSPANTTWKFYSTYEGLDIWQRDQRGTLNAVYGYLRALGVRWYMPGDLGEIVPKMTSIALPDMNEEVLPDFTMRRMCGPFRVVCREDVLWKLRLGLNEGLYGTTAHGLAGMTRGEKTQAAHPEYYALYNGRRATDINQLCFSSEELFQETVRYVRALFDTYDYETVSVMPNDAFTAICQCEKCEGKATYERGSRGRLSDYVWDFVNRVAIEVYKTHPNKTVNCLAYGSYREPPLKIDKLSPNVLVGIVSGRRPMEYLPEEREMYRNLREGWMAKTGNPIFVFENYPFTGRGAYLPFYAPHTIAQSINNTKGKSLGEDIWFSINPDPYYDGQRGLHSPGFYHLNIWMTARWYWGGVKDPEPVLAEYYNLYYGPAAEEMKAFIEYSEYHWRDFQKDADEAKKALAMFAAAKAKASPESVYGKRLALVDDYLKGLRKKATQLEVGRVGVPEIAATSIQGKALTIDGKLDDAFWQAVPETSGGTLKVLQTGEPAPHGTSFKVAFDGEYLVYGIRCEGVKGDPAVATTDKNEDPAIWMGDAVEILIETNSHSYYQIAINPKGAFADLDRLGGKQKFLWDSQATIATHIGDGFWTVEAKVGYVPNNEDPLHQLDGAKPTAQAPWYFNVCRQRARDGATELSAWSPTLGKTFHDVMKFGKLTAQ